MHISQPSTQFVVGIDDHDDNDDNNNDTSNNKSNNTCLVYWLHVVSYLECKWEVEAPMLNCDSRQMNCLAVCVPLHMSSSVPGAVLLQLQADTWGS